MNPNKTSGLQLPAFKTTMALENTYVIPPHTLPTPADSPVENAAIGIARRASRHGSISRFSNRSSKHFSRDSENFFARGHGDSDVLFSDKRSSIDSRKFTNDLDNSLLQQIHALRSELESKNKLVDNLEDTLHQSKTENSKLNDELTTRLAESRSLKKQMQLLENGTMSAIDELAGERDSALKSMGDFRDRLETANKKMRSQEENVEALETTRGQEQQAWADEKRNFERRIHVMENRLKTMVAEMIAAESANPNRPGTSGEDHDSRPGSAARAESSSIRSVSRSESRMSNRSIDEPRESRDFRIRAPSRLSALHEVGESSSNLSLAAELEAEGSDDDLENDIVDSEVLSPGALPEEMIFRPSRLSQDHKARKVMGLPLENGNVFNSAEGRHSHEPQEHMASTSRSQRQPFIAYVDATTQSFQPFSNEEESEKTADALTQTLQEERKVNNSTSTQTDEAEEPIADPPSDMHVSPGIPTKLDNTTQTDKVFSTSLLDARNRLFRSEDDVPTIAIHPPGSRPSSSHTSVMLPPRTKNAGTQADFEVPKVMRTAGTQTTDSLRLMQLPPRGASTNAVSRLHERRKNLASAIPPKSSRRKLKSPPPLLQHDPPPASPPISSIQHFYPGKNDDGPLNDKHQNGPRRPIRSGSILAGFSDDNLDTLDRDDEFFSDDELAGNPPIRKTLSKIKDSWRLIPQAQPTDLDRIESMSDTEEQVEPGRSDAGTRSTFRDSVDSAATSARTFGPGSSKAASNKQMNVRRTALASSGPTAQYQRHRSPSMPSVSSTSTGNVVPPFPVPSRSSSRKIPLSASEGAASPTPYTTSFYSSQRPEQDRPTSKRKILRKTQSAAAVTKPGSDDVVPPLPKAKGRTPPKTPPSPRRINSRFSSKNQSRNDQTPYQRPKSSTNSPQAPASVESQGSDVIHAVTQTMIGEWMFKYVRKRRSFGVTDNAQNEFEKGSVGATRHKRWVWVLPRERAVVWSEKEPTTTLAIGGKGARKRGCCLTVASNLCLLLTVTIQSVLDVPDTTPLPKGYNSDQICNQSILILTPERALKLTAVSRERHYIWLTALSYISSSDFNLTLVEGTYLAPSQTPTRGSLPPSRQPERISEDAAEPPQVPRTHARKRSSTGPKPMPLNLLHSYSTNAVATASSYDVNTSTIKERNEKPASGPTTRRGTMTRNVTEPRVVPNDHFDAIGTVRMEAFVDDVISTPEPWRKQKRQEGKRKDMSYWGVDDPFRGF